MDDVSTWLDETVEVVQENEILDATNAIVITLGGDGKPVIIRAYDWNIPDLLEASTALNEWVKDRVQECGI